MANNITDLFQEKVVPGLYKQYYQQSSTSWMEANAIGVEYKGGKFITMRDMTVDGLGDYDRQLGYPRGTVQGTKKQYELTKDRGREFLIDAADNDETGFLVSAANIMMIFQRDHVIPEIDAYRYSHLHDLVKAGNAANVRDTNISKATMMSQLIADIAEIRDIVGDVPLVITMSGLTQQFLGTEFTKNLDMVNFMKGNVYSKVKALDGNPIQIVPSNRLKSAITLHDGVTAGQTAGGYVIPGAAEDMKWIITPLGGPIAAGKIDKMRVFTPEEYQSAHAWKTDYRIYHDLWLLDRDIEGTIIRTGDLVV